MVGHVTFLVELNLIIGLGDPTFFSSLLMLNFFIVVIDPLVKD